MVNKKTVLKRTGGFLLSIGILLVFLICGLIVWGDLEATMFTDGMNGDKRVTGLNCPVLITSKETGKISVILKNPADKDSDRFVRTSISEGFAILVRENKEKVPIAANGKAKVEWKIYPEDAAFKRIVLFRVYIPPKYPYPSMSGSCGVIKIDFPWLKGDQVLIASTTIAAVFMGLGAFFIEKGIQPDTGSLPSRTRKRTNGIYALAVVLVFSGVLSYLGLWLLGVFGLAVAILLSVLVVLRV